MGALVFLIIVVAALVLFDALAVRYGVDSRIESDDPRRSPYPPGIS
jgi:hypothetical protein